MKKILYFLSIVVFVGCVSSIPKVKQFQELDVDTVQNHNKDFSIEIPKDWYPYYEYHHLIAYSPRKYKKEVESKNINVYLTVFSDVSSKNIDEELSSYLEKMSKSYKNFGYKTIDAKHSDYGKYYIVKYRVQEKEKIYLAMRATILHNHKMYGFYYLALEKEFDNYLVDVIKTINSLKIKNDVK
jgi:hypothetical protein